MIHNNKLNKNTINPHQILEWWY